MNDSIVHIHFYSYFKDLVGQSETTLPLQEPTPLKTILEQVYQKYPQLQPLQKSTLIAVDVEYQPLTYRVSPHQTVSLFPPVQGG